jgi:hypothetical protein
VVLDRLRADVQLRRDHRVVVAGRDQLQDVELAFGQLGADRVRGLRRDRGRPHLLQHLPRDRGGDERFPDGCRDDAADELVDRRVLEQVAARAGEDGVEHVVVLVGDGQHQHARERREAVDLADRLDPGHAGHVQVHHDDVGGELAHEPHSVGALAGLAGDLDATLLEQVP